jgi:hypothetical protein
LDEQRYPSHRTAARLDPTWRGSSSVGAAHIDPTDAYADEPKYSAWKVSLFIIVFCGAFWAGVSYLAMRLLG